MGAMTVIPRNGEEWTVDDLDRVLDDGLQYELLDGLLLVTPAPVVLHQRAIGNLYLLLRSACPAGFEVFLAPVDWRPDVRTSLQPDLLVVRDEDVGVKNVTAPLVLAVEVLSASTRRNDQVLKRSKYEDSGVGSSTRKSRRSWRSTSSAAGTSRPGRPRVLAVPSRATLPGGGRPGGAGPSAGRVGGRAGDRRGFRGRSDAILMGSTTALNFAAAEPPEQLAGVGPEVNKVPVFPGFEDLVHEPGRCSSSRTAAASGTSGPDRTTSTSRQRWTSWLTATASRRSGPRPVAP